MASKWLPLYVNPGGLRVVVFGGGTVATRRALMFAEAGAIVEVYSLEFSSELLEAAERGLLSIARIDLREARLEEVMKEASLVVIATSDESLNERILSQALALGKLVNYPPDGKRGNIIVPFRGETSYGLKFAVTSLGETGVGARRARDRIQAILERDESLKRWYRAMKRVKELLRGSVADYKLRYKLYFVIERDREFAGLVENGMIDEAINRAREIIEESTQSSKPEG